MKLFLKNGDRTENADIQQAKQHLQKGKQS